ncbi:MAG TPA: UDP-glucose 4-epimerase GalE [Kineosporiaceae bacterium]|nr:UDP-glucose 4-epimerase GalE [Kineosporiaceae bacterium]
MTTWLLTGGAGYIGSHVARAMLAAGQQVVVLDDLSSGDRSRIPAGVPLVVASVSDQDAVRHTLRTHRVSGVVHLAAKKSVEESCADPLHYYQQNLVGLLSLLQAMRAEAVGRLVFSSSAAVYGTPAEDGVDESAQTLPESPYGRTKLVGEWMVRDAATAYGISAVSLRYFNVVGCALPELADAAGANLFPRILQRVAAGLPVTVFGGDYPTLDGTCVRDYIHVQDLAEAHVAAAALTATEGCDEVINVGCGRGYSVLEVLAEFGRSARRPLVHIVAPRRAGDPASMVADAGRAASLLGWKARFGLAEMVASAWGAAMQPGTAAEHGGEVLIS